MDARINQIFYEEMRGDTSFSEKASALSLLFPKRYTESEVKTIWHQGIRLGIEFGLRRASIEGQIVELKNNVSDAKQKQFLTEFFELCSRYGVAIQHHPSLGMVIVDREFNPFK